MIGAAARMCAGYAGLAVIAAGIALCAGSVLTSVAHAVHALLRGAGLL